MRTVLLLFISLLILPYICAQQKTPDEIKVLFNDAEFFLAQEAYVDALYEYNELYNNGLNANPNINYKIGICYLNIPGQKEKSVPFLSEAVKDVSKKYKVSSIKQKSAPVDAWLFLGNAYRVNNNLKDAIAAYTHYKELTDRPEEVTYADQQIAACQTAQLFFDNEKQVKLTNLGDSVNGPSSNFKGVISGNGKILLYMNELPFYNAVYYSVYSGTGWSTPINITPQIQSDGDQYVTSVSYDGTTLFLTKEDPFNSDIYVSRFQNGTWNKSIPVSGEDINTKFWESHASISRDGKKLYLASNRKDGSGNMDIYVSEIQQGGNWGKPVNLGPVINTALNEDTPFISENDSLLFFSSQGHENMGGYDIFVSRLDMNGQWTKPVNLGYPVNTTDDDLFYYPWNNNKVGFLARVVKDGFGKEDIYALQAFGDSEFREVLGEMVNESKLSTDKPSENDKPVAEAETDVERTEEPAPPSETAEPSEPAEPLTVSAPEKPRAAPKEVELIPAYFGFDRFSLTETARDQLAKVKGFLDEFASAKVKLTGHADAVGPAEYNLKLSAKRAEVAKEYLVSLGIESSRIETIAMGERNFAAVNSNPDGSDNPEGRRLNRRVEYEIIETEDSPLIFRMTPVPENLKYRP